jgi:uncharacterized ion transporter superfamily protein YfcC
VETAPPARRKFAFPSAYTILFILIMVVAALTWVIPAGRYDYDAEGKPVPATYHEVPANPQRIILDAFQAPIAGMYGIQDETGNVSVWNRASCSAPSTWRCSSSSSAASWA